MASIRRKIKSTQEKSQLHADLLLELESIAELEHEYGVIRHHIVKQRPVTKYSHGRQHETGMMEVVTKDGQSHIVPAHLLETAQ